MSREKRQFERVASQISVKYASKKSEITGHSLTSDIGAGGMGLPVEDRLPVGEKMYLTVTLQRDEPATIFATARVRWSRKNPERWKARYNSGLEFVEIDPSDKAIILNYARRHRWIKSDFERALENNEVPVLGKKGGLVT